MASYTCEVCKKIFTQNGLYTKHVNKKKHCDPRPNAVTDIIEPPPPMAMAMPMAVVAGTELPTRFIDLFCGIGSFHYSFKKLNWECVMSCDIDNAVKDTYKHNYGLLPLGDITEIDPADVPSYDILCAGFPCQPFSQCGQHKGFDDKRGTLFFNIMKFVQHHRPKIIVLEKF